MRKTSGSDDIQFLEEDIFITRVPLIPNVPENRLDTLLRLIDSNPQISMLELARILNVNHKTIKRDFEKLKTDGLLERIGPDRGGYWEIIKKNKQGRQDGKSKNVADKVPSNPLDTSQ